MKTDKSVRETFRLALACKENKVVTLEEAIKRNIKPGMSVFISLYGNAAVREIVRQFWGTKPGFTVIEGGRNYNIVLVYCELVKKLIGPAFGEGRRSRIIQRAEKEGKIEIENWTVLTIIQRLMAGAMNTGCMVTKSMLGSSIAGENSDSFKEIEDPFNSGQKIALLKALNPDIAVVHGWAADPWGNIITGMPYRLGFSVWGARAAYQGVVATVEKIVSTDFIRKYSHLVTIPGHIVNSVSEVPLGAHPQMMHSWGLGIKEFSAYDEDVAFVNDYELASCDRDKFEAWLREWMLNCRTQEEYLHKLGAKKVANLTMKVNQNTWKRRLVGALKTIEFHPKCTNTDRMIVAAAREIKKIVIDRKYKIMLAGGGLSRMATNLAYYQLTKEGYPVKILIGTGIIGYLPLPGGGTEHNMLVDSTAEMMTNCFESYGWIVGGLNNRCLSLLGIGQCDKYGNINSTREADGSFLVGSGGANDAINADEVFLMGRQSRDRFLDKVTYITCPGSKAKTLVSDKGVFKKLGDDNEFTLTDYLSNPNIHSIEEGVRMVRENCGWELKVSPKVKEISPPTNYELAVIRTLDPEGS